MEYVTKRINETLDELADLAREMRQDHSLIESKVRRLEAIQQMLEYYLVPREGYVVRESLIEDVSCCSCNKSWRDVDACLIKVDGLWYCRDHHPPAKEGGIKPVGWVPPQEARDALDTARKEAWQRLTPAERKLINSRIV